jgi:hypothetical protein
VTGTISLLTSGVGAFFLCPFNQQIHSTTSTTQLSDDVYSLTNLTILAQNEGHKPYMPAKTFVGTSQIGELEILTGLTSDRRRNLEQWSGPGRP